MVPRALRLSLLGALLCASSGANVARAEAPTAAQGRADAKARFERAIRLFEDGSYESALVEFRTSLVDYPTRVAAFNIAVCLRKLGRFDEEEDALAYVAERFPSTRRADVTELHLARQEAADRIATLSVTVDEPGASVYVDGRLRGLTPLGPLRVSAGVRRILVKKEQFRAFEMRLDLPARTARALAVTLDAEATPVATTTAPVVIAPAPAPREPARSRAPLWPVFALGGAGLGGGIAGAVLLGLRSSTIDEARETCRPGLDQTAFTACQDLESRASLQRVLGGVFLGGGAALLVGAGVYLGLRGARTPGSVSMLCTPTLGGLGCSGRF